MKLQAKFWFTLLLMSISVASVDQGYTGPHAAQAAAAHGIQLEVVKLAEAKRGFVLLPRR